MIECLVIGAGQAGLSCAALLKEAQVDYLVVDGGAQIGDVWRHRPRSLRLFTSRRFCQLGDMPMPGVQDGYPTAAEFADYLGQFAAPRTLQVQLNAKVVRLAGTEGAFVANLADGSIIHARTVIDATGANQVARVPAYSSDLDSVVHQLTAASYTDPDSVRAEGTVLVVGDGASGRQIAMELARTYPVALATGRVRKLVPNVVFGRDIFWWLTKIGVLFAPPESIVARIMRRRDPIPARDADNGRLRLAGVQIHQRAVSASQDRVHFADGSSLQIATVIWCGGYSEDLSWLALDRVEVDNGQIRHLRGRTSQPGFFITGRKWLTCRASELVLGADADARRVSAYVVQQLGAKRPAATFVTGVQ